MSRLLRSLSASAVLLFLFISTIGVHADDPGDPDLATISELTGMVASYVATSSDCMFSVEYDVYLCEEPGTTPPPPDPAARATAQAILDSGGTLLLIPDSSNDRVMAFDAATGALVDADFIPSDPDHLSTPVEAFASADGSSILVSDQLEDVVQEYDQTGAYVGVFAPTGGPNTTILDNVRGMALRSNGNLLVTSADANTPDYVAEFDTAGAYIAPFIASGSGGLDSPYDVFPYDVNWLVSGSSSENVLRYDDTGAFLDEFVALDRFPQQLAEAANGNLLIANFVGDDAGVVEVQADGTIVGIYIPPTFPGFRGVYELPNGNLLVASSIGVHEITRAGTLVDTKIDGIQARFINEYSQSPGPTPTPTATMGIPPSPTPTPDPTLTATLMPTKTPVPTGTPTATAPFTSVELGTLTSEGSSGAMWLIALLGLTAIGAAGFLAQQRRR